MWRSAPAAVDAAKCIQASATQEGGALSAVDAAALRHAVETGLSASRPIVLAVSGGRDSMALMHAAARWAPRRIATVATFDHATGEHATAAASLVVAEARRLGLAVIRERARVVPGARPTEASWRESRWNFLHRVARAHDAAVATAHSRDDQIETVVMRILRGAGARGIAALAAPSEIVRPWLTIARADIAAWADEQGVAYLDDPSNRSPRHLRNRIRHELLPAFEVARPGFGDTMTDLGNRAAAWRADLERWVDGFEPSSPRAGALRVPADALSHLDDAGRALVWPALFARIGVTLDARGTAQLVRFTSGDRRGAMATLPRGAVAIRTHDARGNDAFELRRGPLLERRTLEWAGPAESLPPRLGAWRFRRVTSAVHDVLAVGLGSPPSDSRSAPNATPAGPWVMALPAGGVVRVRRWQAGDRIRTPGATAGRRVTRYFAEAGIPALDRLGWPVVLVDETLTWVPGICRGLAAPHRPGRPDPIWYRCEHEQ